MGSLVGEVRILGLKKQRDGTPKVETTVMSFGLDDSGVLRALVKDVLKVHPRETKRSFRIDSEVAPRKSAERLYVFRGSLTPMKFRKTSCILDPIYLQATFKECSHNVIYG